MSTLNAYSRLTLKSHAERINDGNILEIAEILAQTNPILNDIPFRQANSHLGERISRRTSVPRGSYRKVNQGIDVEASGTEPAIESIAHLEARSEIDVELVRKSPNPSEYRSTEDMAFVEGLGQTAAETLVYGNISTDPEKLNGFAVRRNSLSDSNVYNNGGSGNDLTSIYIVKYGFNAVYGIVPGGSKVGLDMRDLGEMRVTDADGKPFQALCSLFTWDMGIVEKDPRCIKRIANIETAGSSNIFDEDLLIEALNAFPGSAAGAVIYVNRTLKTQMDIYAKDKTNINYGFAEFGGVPTTAFRGIPVRQCDGILDTESAVA